MNFVKEINVNPQLRYQMEWKTLSGLPVPVLQITDFGVSSISKTIVLISARTHPGQSNSSHVCHGFIKSLLGDDQKIKQILKQFHFFIVPMVNPDGVVAGNYRTSLFGKDLNRTFHQSRKYAFPQSLNLTEFAKTLKNQYKQRFTTYIDLHGHSLKKNIFLYGPDYSISHNFYYKSREFAKILGNLSSMFRYYSCSFRISSSKGTTARAILNRIVNIPFTYTLQSSNGAYYDSIIHIQKPFTAKSWMEMGNALVKGLYIWNKSQNSLSTRLKKSMQKDEEEQQRDKQQLDFQKQIRQKQPPGQQKISDDQISEGGSDSQPADQDFNEIQLRQLQKQIQGKNGQTTIVKSVKKQVREKLQISPEKSQRKNNTKYEFDWSQNLRQPPNFKTGKQTYKIIQINRQRMDRLPPLNSQPEKDKDRSIKFLDRTHNKKRSLITQALKNLTAPEGERNDKNDYVQRKQRFSISQLMMSQKQTLNFDESQLLLQNKYSSKRQLTQKMRRKR